MNINKRKILLYLQSVITGFALILLSIPAFNMTGNVIKPLLVSIIGSALICACLLFLRSSEHIAGISLIIFMVFWLIVAAVKEALLQIEAGFVFDWIYFFYFDKLLIIGVIWFTITSFFCIRRLISKKDDDYSSFFKTASVAFLIFYVFLLVYSFVLTRLQAGEYPFRFQPFVTIREYITNSKTIPYEVFMMFFGNLLYFTPLGYIFSRILRNKKTPVKITVNILFPIITFCLLELSQYILQNGFCEFDDMMMNSIGFWLGNLLFLCSNKLAYIISKKRFCSFWN